MRTVAILGRPNVGKSTLFNRLVGRRRAIVHDMPGVTRDRLEGEAELAGLKFRVIDTAGMMGHEDAALAGSLEARLTASAMAGLEQADMGLFLIDAREGVTPLDEELARRLRKVQRPIVLIANKCEGHRAIAGAAEAWSLGLGEPIPVSAEHGDGLADLLDALRLHIGEPVPEAVEEDETWFPPEEPILEVDPDAEKTPEFIRLAVVGRPNVGKSSLINRLIDDDRLLTGPEPGLTRDAVDVAWEHDGRRIELVDTAGLRRRARIEAPVEKLSASSSVRAIGGAHVVLLVVDAQQPLEHQDLTIANLALDEGRALLIAANKWDLLADGAAVLAEIKLLAEEKLSQVKGVPILAISARTGRGVDRILPAVVKSFERWHSRISTGKLNRWLEEALTRNPPPMAQGRPVKIRYMTQTTNRPPTFALFANKSAEYLPDSYIRYLAASLRAAFDLEGVPLRFRVRHGENPYERG